VDFIVYLTDILTVDCSVYLLWTQWFWLSDFAFEIGFKARVSGRQGISRIFMFNLLPFTQYWITNISSYRKLIIIRYMYMYLSLIMWWWTFFLTIHCRCEQCLWPSVSTVQLETQAEIIMTKTEFQFWIYTKVCTTTNQNNIIWLWEIMFAFASLLYSKLRGEKMLLEI
jgi:hypothetical protein